jgi:ferredoxin
MPTAPPVPAFRVRLAPDGPEFTASADRPLLQSAALAGIELPSSCRNGTCRTCICQALGGEVGYRIEWPGLLPEEKAEGWILPCVAHPCSDLVLSQPRARVQSFPLV